MKRITSAATIAAVISIFVFGSRNVFAEEYQYDDLNRLTKVIYDDGNYAEYEYDKNGNLLRVHEESPEETKPAPEESSKGSGGSGGNTTTAGTGTESSAGNSETSAGMADGENSDGIKEKPFETSRPSDGQKPRSNPKNSGDNGDSPMSLEGAEYQGENTDQSEGLAEILETDDKSGNPDSSGGIQLPDGSGSGQETEHGFFAGVKRFFRAAGDFVAGLVQKLVDWFISLFE